MLEVGLHTVMIVVLARGGGARVSFGTAYDILMASQWANAVTPFRAGAALRVYLYKRLAGVEPGAGAALVVIEGVLSAAIPALGASAGIAWLFPALGLTGPLGVLLALGVACALPWCIPSRWGQIEGDGRLMRAAGKSIGLALRVRAALRRVRPWTVAAAAGCVVLSLLVQGVRLDSVLGLGGASRGSIEATVALTVANTLGIASLVPMGLGVRDASLAWLLNALAVPGGVIGIALVAQRIFTPGLYLLLGLECVSRLGLRKLLARTPRSADAGARS